MACLLTAGRKQPCKKEAGGLHQLYFIDYGLIGDATLGADDEVTDLTGTFSAYKYEMKGNGSFEQTITSSRENGTTFFEQKLTVTLTGLTKEDHKEIKLLSYGRPHVVVVDNNDNAFIAGLKHGMDVVSGTVVTGAALGDLSGYTLELTGMEKLPANFIEGATIADPFVGLSSATATIVSGA